MSQWFDWSQILSADKSPWLMACLLEDFVENIWSTWVRILCSRHLQVVVVLTWGNVTWPWFCKAFKLPKSMILVKWRQGFPKKHESSLKTSYFDVSRVEMSSWFAGWGWNLKDPVNLLQGSQSLNNHLHFWKLPDLQELFRTHKKLSPFFYVTLYNPGS